MKQTIGYEIVYRSHPRQGTLVSFRVKGPGGKTIPGTDCPLWFKNEAAARGCARQLIAKVVDDLRRLGHKVEKYSEAN